MTWRYKLIYTHALHKVGRDQGPGSGAARIIIGGVVTGQGQSCTIGGVVRAGALQYNRWGRHRSLAVRTIGGVVTGQGWSITIGGVVTGQGRSI